MTTARDDNDKSSARTHNECRAACEASDAHPENCLLRNTPDTCILLPLDAAGHGDRCLGITCVAIESHAAIATPRRSRLPAREGVQVLLGRCSLCLPVVW